MQAFSDLIRSRDDLQEAPQDWMGGLDPSDMRGETDENPFDDTL